MAVEAMAELPAQMSNEYSGALWEIGDFLFAARSIAKIANGNGGWGDAFAIGISAASVFLPPLKLGKLATPALKTVVAESEKMLATDVVSPVARRQLEKNIKNGKDLLDTPEAGRMTRAEQLDNFDPTVGRPEALPRSGTALSEQGGVLKPVETEMLGVREHPMPPENVIETATKTPATKETSYPSASGETEPRDLSSWLTDPKYNNKRIEYTKLKSKLSSGEIKRSDLTTEQQRTLEVFDHYRNPKNKINVTLTDEQGNKYPGYMYNPFKEGVDPAMSAGGAQREFNFADFWEEKLSELDNLIKTKKEYTSKIEKLAREIKDPETNPYLINVIRKEAQETYEQLYRLEDEDKELMNWLRGTYKDYWDNATADKGLSEMSEITFGTTRLPDDVIKQIKGEVPAAPKSMLSSGKPASKKFTAEAAKARKAVEEEDAKAFQERDMDWVDRDIITAEESREAGLVGEFASDSSAQRRMDTQRIEDLPQHLQEDTSKWRNPFAGKDYGQNKEDFFDDIMEQQPVRGTPRIKELEADLEQLKYRAGYLVNLIKKNPGLRQGKATKVKELATTNRQIKEAAAALTKARSKKLSEKSSIDVVATTDQKRHVARIKDLLSPTMDIAGYGATKPKTVFLLDRIDKIEGLLTEQGRLNLFRKLRQSGSSEKQAKASIERYEKQLEKLKAKADDNENKFMEAIGKLDSKSKAIISSRIDALDETALKQIATRRTSVYAQETYLRRLMELTDNPDTKERILNVIDKLDLKPSAGADKILKETVQPSKAEVITSFRDKHRFLSNMSPSSITIEGIRYPTVEHAFQAAKTTDKELRKKIARAANPKEAKRMGRELDLRSDWNNIRVKAMEYILRKKFEDPKLRKQLLETGESKLIEGNTWGDKFWGQVDGEGKNVLGELLMKIRKELMEGRLSKEVKETATESTGEVVRLKKLSELGLKRSDVVDIGRSGEFGNPFRVDRSLPVEKAAQEAVKKYRKWLWDKIQAEPDYAKKLYELKGKKLACPGGEKDINCHGQVILKAIKYLEAHPELMKGK